MIFAAKRISFTAVSFLLVANCSNFNMSPPCKETAVGLMRHLAVADYSNAPNDDKLAKLVTVSNMIEVGSDYNERTCRANLSAFGRSVDLVYHVEQSQGVKGWYEIEILNGQQSSVVSFIRDLRAAYAN